MELAHQPLVPGCEERSHTQTEMAPMIGKWEEVAPEDQFENQRKLEMQRRGEVEAELQKDAKVITGEAGIPDF